MWRKSLYLKGGTTGATWVKQHLTRSYDRGHLRPKGTRGQEHDATRLTRLSSLSRCIGGRVDREVAHPGPSQIRTCPTRASGSSNLQVCYVPTVVCTILTRGSGYCSKRRTKRSQRIRRRWERRFSHFRQRRVTSHRTRRNRCSLPVIP